MYRNFFFVALALILACTVDTSLQADLIGYWPMDGDTNDATSNGLDGELIGDAEFVDDVPGPLGDGMSLILNKEFVEIGGGSQDEIIAEDNFGYVDLGNPDLLNFSDNDFTVSSWMKVPDGLFQRGNIFSNGGDNGGGVRYVLAYLENGGQSIVLTTDDNSDKRQAQADAFDWVVDDEEWHHVVGVKTETDLQVWVDGELAGENLDVPDGYDLSGTSQRPAYIGLGADSGSGDFEKFYQGWVDDVAVWDEALDEDQIAKVMSGDFSQWLGAGTPGDYNDDGVLDAKDIDLQAVEMKLPPGQQDKDRFDHNDDNRVNEADRTIWVKQLRKTWVGDANLDNEFNSGDLVAVFSAGKYETGEMAGWAEGDWSGDMAFDSGDLVAAFSDGGYEQGPAAVAAVPEPSSAVLVLIGLFALGWHRQQRRG